MSPSAPSAPSALPAPLASPRHDLRLVPATLGAWGLAATLVGGRDTVALTLTLVGLAVAGASARRRPGIAVTAVLIATVTASVAWRLGDVQHSPLREWTGHRVTVEAEVVRDARTFTRFGEESAVVGLRVRRATAGSRTLAVTDRVTAFVDGPADDLVVGRRLSLTGRLAPPRDSADVATLDVLSRGPARPGAWWWEGAQRLRAGVRGAVAHTGPEPSALVPALVDGDDAALDDSVKEEFRRAGLTHLLAVSGTNLTIVLAMVLASARAVGAPRRSLVPLGLLAVLGFVLLARPDPSVVRAAGMGVVGLAALGYGRSGGVRALAVAILVLLFFDPWLSRSVGFVLSVCATAGILVVVPVLTDRLIRWLPRWAAVAVAVPLAAQLACTPPLAAISGEVSLAALPANVLAGPAVAPVTIAGLLGGLVHLVDPQVAQLPGTLAGGGARWILWVGETAAAFAGAAVVWDAPWWTLLPVVLGVLAGLWFASRRPPVFAGVMLGLLLAVVRPPSPGWPPDGWVLATCDVGQGQATVVATGPDTALLVDVGPEPGAVDRCLDGLGVRRLAAVVLTHAHIDHTGGLAGARTGRRTGPVLVGASGGGPSGAREVVAGDRFTAGSAVVEVLWPTVETSSDNPNDLSVVLRVETAGIRLLLTGDIEPAAQEALLRTGADVTADVLTVPHHGSARQSARFLAAIGARVATISAGADNDYGHPATAALDLLRETGTSWWRTDLDGDVAVVVAETGALRVVSR